MKASVVLEKKGNYEILSLDDDDGSKLLVLHKLTETGAPFFVVAGYFLGEVGRFDEDSLLAEIETVPETEYAKLKEMIRKVVPGGVPITFW